MVMLVRVGVWVYGSVGEGEESRSQGVEEAGQ